MKSNTLQVTTLKAVRIGVLTDVQLQEALDHYLRLSILLTPHGEIYGLVYRDVRNTYHALRRMEKARQKS